MSYFRYATLEKLLERVSSLRGKLIFRVENLRSLVVTNYYQVFSIAEYVRFRNTYRGYSNYCAHEFIPATQARKLYVDLDITGDALLSFDASIFFAELLKASTKVLPNFQPQQLTVFSSHAEGSKLSYHILFQGYAVANAQEASLWVRKIWEHMPMGTHSPDWGVYIPNGCFRAFGWSKIGTSRKKIIALENQTRFASTFELLCASLVTYITKEVSLPTLCEQHIIYDDLTPPSIDPYLALLPLELKDTVVFHKIHGNKILLFRTQPGFCPTCQRVHESENPYLRVDNDSTVYWMCRRNTHGTLLGNIQTPLEKVTKTPVIEYRGKAQWIAECPDTVKGTKDTNTSSSPSSSSPSSRKALKIPISAKFVERNRKYTKQHKLLNTEVTLDSRFSGSDL